VDQWNRRKVLKMRALAPIGVASLLWKIAGAQENLTRSGFDGSWSISGHRRVGRMSMRPSTGEAGWNKFHYQERTPNTAADAQ
jgi:hypothetical protein